MISYPYHPAGLIAREQPNGRSRFTVVDPVDRREVSHGGDWQAAYNHWLKIRRARVPVPNPMPLLWLVKEFSECRRMADERLRAAHETEMHSISVVLKKLGDPHAAGLRDVDCVAFRNACAAVPRLGPVATETLIRRIRQAWIWGCEQGWLQHECPFSAEQRDTAIKRELVGVVASYLPDDALTRVLSARKAVGPIAEEQIRGLSRAVRRAARLASDQARRDGRPDLVDWLSRCKLSWMLNTSIDGSLLLSNAMQTMASGRIERVAELKRRCAKDAVKAEARD
ncbi:hypothetical protein [Paraburkholderia sp. J10-1]|uniref:hypothetical protein n=1 Tax=Paraburkholderia sp. J10-1 TaxID=2805430 RepID=UPI002AB76E8D|nr:hypothetical protein [Paraburkholderia sp. J10-1]